jgi:hypothetical protein
LELVLKIKNDFSCVQTNVSIASAITSYARIEMMQYKLNYDVLYSDTDSIFTSDKLPDHLIGGELGMMKDELEGDIIREGYFFGIKQYGYLVIDKSCHSKVTTVFAGVKRNSLTWRDILNLAKGDGVNVKNDVRFYKSFDTLSISIRESMSNLVVSTDKKLLNNVYHPIHITTTNPCNPVVFYMKRMIKLINKFMRPPLLRFIYATPFKACLMSINSKFVIRVVRVLTSILVIVWPNRCLKYKFINIFITITPMQMRCKSNSGPLL